MCAVLFKGDCGWEEEKDPDLFFVMRCYLYKLRILVFFLIYLYVCQN